jgi:hypothetical protein
MISGTNTRVDSRVASSATPPPAIAPAISWPSAPMFQTLARKHTASPTPHRISGVAFKPSSAQPRRVASGSSRNVRNPHQRIGAHQRKQQRASR